MDLTQTILKGLGKGKVRSILKRWCIDQVNLNLEHGKGAWGFDVSIHAHDCNKYGLPVIDDDCEYYIDELCAFIGNKI